MKKLLAILLSALCVMSMAACTKKEEAPPIETPPVTEQPTQPIAPNPDTQTDIKADPKLVEAKDAVKKALGEGYIPSMNIESKMLSELYGVNMENVDSFVAEGPAMSNNVDAFIGVKAKSGKAADVESDLKKFRDYLINDSMQYPSNLAKVNASQVITKGDYVFFVMVGAMNDNMDASEADQTKFAQDEMKKAVDALDTVFKK
ncbi:MAG: DUF4358 domain-containing protein [Oscillospiraceae bacterium]